jgi:hypothetical protein
LCLTKAVLLKKIASVITDTDPGLRWCGRAGRASESRGVSG